MMIQFNDLLAKKIQTYLVVLFINYAINQKVPKWKAKQEIDMLGWVCLADYF